MKIEIFEKALCCETGVCGSSVDPELLRITLIVKELKGKGIDIERYNLSSRPEMFIKNTIISEYIREHGVDGLPITLLDDKVIKEKEYLTNAELENITKVQISGSKPSGGCGCGSKGCC